VRWALAFALNLRRAGFLAGVFAALVTATPTHAIDGICRTEVFWAGAPTPLPEFSQYPHRHGDRHHTIVIGTGNIVVGRENGYLRAAENAHAQTGAQFYFVDNSEFFSSDRQADIDEITKRGFTFHDVRPRLAGETWYDVLGRLLNQISPDAVIIATPDETHIPIAREVLRRDPGIPRVIIEKPLSHSLDEAEQFATLLREQSWEKRVFVVDHFRARFPQIAAPSLARILTHLGGAISSAHVYYLEDGSGGARDGAIESIDRVRTLDHGVAFLDLLPHALGLFQFADYELKGLTLFDIDAGKYVGVDGDPNRPSLIREETFGRARYHFDSQVQNRRMRFDISVYMGKGIRGHDLAGVRYVENVKLIYLTGLDPSRSVLIDLGSKQAGPTLREANAIHLLERQPDGNWVLPAENSIPLVGRPYQAMVQMEVTDPRSNHGVMPFGAAMQMQRHLARALELRNQRYHAADGSSRPYLLYPGGMAPAPDGTSREAWMLRDILRLLRHERAHRRFIGP
jgi:hypothetical protein